jgi:hypothetical protein
VLSARKSITIDNSDGVLDGGLATNDGINKAVLYKFNKSAVPPPITDTTGNTAVGLDSAIKTGANEGDLVYISTRDGGDDATAGTLGFRLVGAEGKVDQLADAVYYTIELVCRKDALLVNDSVTALQP